MKPKILVVDDEADFRQLIEYNLTRQDFEVFTAGGGLQALNEARRILPDVILLDLMLPDLDGFSVCQILRAQPSTADVPVIIVSALHGQTTRARSIELGVANYLRKPVDLQALGDLIRAAFQFHREELQARMTPNRWEETATAGPGRASKAAHSHRASGHKN